MFTINFISNCMLNSPARPSMAAIDSLSRPSMVTKFTVDDLTQLVMGPIGELVKLGAGWGDERVFGCGEIKCTYLNNTVE